jgi:hypothetical protein
VNDIVKAIGAGSGAAIVDATNSTATATDGGTALIVNDGSSLVSVTNDAATATNGLALIGDSSGSTATAENTGPGTTDGAAVGYAIDSTASAQGAGSTAVVAGIPSYVADSSAVDTNGTITGITTSDLYEFNSAPLGDLIGGSPTGGEDLIAEIGGAPLLLLGNGWVAS